MRLAEPRLVPHLVLRLGKGARAGALLEADRLGFVRGWMPPGRMHGPRTGQLRTSGKAQENWHHQACQYEEDDKEHSVPKRLRSPMSVLGDSGPVLPEIVQRPRGEQDNPEERKPAHNLVRNHLESNEKEDQCQERQHRQEPSPVLPEPFGVLRSTPATPQPLASTLPRDVRYEDSA